MKRITFLLLVFTFFLCKQGFSQEPDTSEYLWEFKNSVGFDKGSTVLSEEEALFLEKIGTSLADNYEDEQKYYIRLTSYSCHDKNHPYIKAIRAQIVLDKLSNVSQLPKNKFVMVDGGNFTSYIKGPDSCAYNAVQIDLITKLNVELTYKQ